MDHFRGTREGLGADGNGAWNDRAEPVEASIVGYFVTNTEAYRLRPRVVAVSCQLAGVNPVGLRLSRGLSGCPLVSTGGSKSRRASVIQRLIGSVRVWLRFRRALVELAKGSAPTETARGTIGPKRWRQAIVRYFVVGFRQLLRGVDQRSGSAQRGSDSV